MMTSSICGDSFVVRDTLIHGDQLRPAVLFSVVRADGEEEMMFFNTWKTGTNWDNQNDSVLKRHYYYNNDDFGDFITDEVYGAY